MSNRFRNYGLWIAIAAFIPMVLRATGLSHIVPDDYNTLVQSFLGILVLAGIISNPQTENKGFMDDKIKEISEGLSKIKEDVVGTGENVIELKTAETTEKPAETTEKTTDTTGKQQ